MDAVEFLKARYRLCRSKNCPECPLQEKENCCCIMDTIEYAEKAVKIVEQWAKDHPVKTRQSEFLKRFPNADLTRLQPCMIEKDKRPMWCGKYADFGANGCCDECRYAYWNEEVDN